MSRVSYITIATPCNIKAQLRKEYEEVQSESTSCMRRFVRGGQYV